MRRDNVNSLLTFPQLHSFLITLVVRRMLTGHDMVYNSILAFTPKVKDFSYLLESSSYVPDW